MTIKKTLGIIHLWLGLTSGLVVFIVSVTGCLFSFRDELFPFFHRGMAYVSPPENGTALPLSQLQAAAQRFAGKDTISFVDIHAGANRAIEFDVNVNDEAAAKRDWWLTAGWMRGEKIFVDPYTGEVTGSLDMRTEFFGIVRGIHQHLYLKRETGSIIVGSATLMFLVLLITGMVLWWPKNRSAARQRFWFRWKKGTGNKRKNYDLHNIFGFYMFLFGVFFTITGLVWSFDWWETAAYRMFGTNGPVFVHPAKPMVSAVPHPAPVDRALADVYSMKYNFDRIIILNDKKTEGYRIIVQYQPRKFSIWSHSDQLFYDGASGQKFADRLQENKVLSMKWRNSNYDLHTGRTFGLTGAIFAFVASLIIASLPVTGFFVWWGKKKKKKPAAKKPKPIREFNTGVT